jgi:ankyrin repeat protein
MEGSYAFFKAIKFGDFECIKSFVQIDQAYLYEVDTNGRTPLIYACLHNQERIAMFLL